MIDLYVLLQASVDDLKEQNKTGTQDVASLQSEVGICKEQACWHVMMAPA